MHLSIQDLRELLKLPSAAVAIVGPPITAAKSVVSFLRDQSLERKQKKTVAEIAECLNRLNTLGTSLSVPNLQLDPYRLQITDDLIVLVSKLSAARAKKLAREEMKNKELTGVRRWFPLYRPDGFDGWAVQAFYVGNWATLLFILIAGFRRGTGDLGELIFST